MRNEVTRADRRKHPGVKLLAKAICTLKDGDKLRLFVSHLSLTGAFLLCKKPPRTDTVLRVVFYPEKMDPLPPLQVRVIGQRIDPANPEQTGFKVVFLKIDEEAMKQLIGVLDQLGLWEETQPMDVSLLGQ
jgi:hypothetical protein